MKAETKNKQLESLLSHLEAAGEAVAKCSALIYPLYRYVDEMEKGDRPKTVKKLLKLIGIEYEKYKAEIQKYWDTQDKPQELYDNADRLEDGEFEFSVYMKIFQNSNWNKIGEGGPSIGIRIFKHLAEELSERITILHLEAYKLNEKEKERAPISSAA